MKTIVTTLKLLFLLLSLTYCSSSSESEEVLPEPVAADNTTPAEPQVSTSDKKSAETPAKVIRIANIRFRVDNLEASVQQVEPHLKQFDAFVFNSKQSKSQDALTMEYTIKVAPAQLEELLKTLQRESAHLDTKQISSRDVTAEYVDVAARINTKQAVEQRYTDLLQRANKISDILAIEDEIKKVREEREAMQARLKALQQETSYSTIYLSMYQHVPFAYTEDKPGFFTEALAAIANGWELFRNLVIGLLHVWPLWFFAMVAYWFYRLYNRHKSTIL